MLPPARGASSTLRPLSKRLGEESDAVPGLLSAPVEDVKLVLLQGEASAAAHSGVKGGLNLQEAVIEGVHVWFYYLGNEALENWPQVSSSIFPNLVNIKLSISKIIKKPPNNMGTLSTPQYCLSVHLQKRSGYPRWEMEMWYLFQGF